MSSTKKYSIIFFSLLVVLSLLTPMRLLLAVSPGATNALDGLNSTANAGGIKPTADKDLPTIIGGVVGAVLALVGVVFFLLILYAGFNWMMAQGKEEQVTKAKDTIFAAVLGLIVILGAYAITTLAAQLFSDALGMKQ